MIKNLKSQLFHGYFDQFSKKRKIQTGILMRQATIDHVQLHASLCCLGFTYCVLCLETVLTLVSTLNLVDIQFVLASNLPRLL